MSCFPGTNLSRLIATSCCRLEICSNLWCLIPKALYTLCILIGMQHPSDFSTYPHHERTVEKSSRGPEIAINRPGPSIKYTRWKKIIYVIGLINIYTMDLPVIPRYLSTVLANDIYKLSTRNTSGGISFPNFSLLFLVRTFVLKN